MKLVNYGPDDVKAVAAGTASRRQIMVVLTSQTCGEACWHAREDVCRCSCGGRNHGCLVTGGPRPERTSKIDGYLYKLIAVGNARELYPEAAKINRSAGYKSVEKPRLIREGVEQKTPEAIASALQAQGNGEDVWWAQYRYTWSETDIGAPARLKNASASQRKWDELKGWADAPSVTLLWQRVEMPERPAILVVDRTTGKPLPDQNPPEQ
jgi:hypothetical protein